MIVAITINLGFIIVAIIMVIFIEEMDGQISNLDYQRMELIIVVARLDFSVNVPSSLVIKLMERVNAIIIIVEDRHNLYLNGLRFMMEEHLKTSFNGNILKVDFKNLEDVMRNTCSSYNNLDSFDFNVNLAAFHNQLVYH